MPDRISVFIECAPDQPNRLWTDGADRVTHTFSSPPARECIRRARPDRTAPAFLPRVRGSAARGMSRGTGLQPVNVPPPPPAVLNGAQPPPAVVGWHGRPARPRVARACSPWGTAAPGCGQSHRAKIGKMYGLARPSGMVYTFRGFAARSGEGFLRKESANGPTRIAWEWTCVCVGGFDRAAFRGVAGPASSSQPSPSAGGCGHDRGLRGDCGMPGADGDGAVGAVEAGLAEALAEASERHSLAGLHSPCVVQVAV